MESQQAADLAALMRAAAEQDDAQSVENDGAMVGAPDPVAETAAALSVVVAVVSPLLPYVESIYTPEVQARLAAAYVPVAEKYGWTAGGWFEQYGAEIALAVTVAPLAMQTKVAHAEWVAEREREARKREPARVESKPAPVGPAAVQFGTASPVEVAA
jgi:hypothetical protein